VEPGRRHDLLGNRLVLIGSGPDGPPPEPPDLDLDAILGDGPAGHGLVEAVPAGRYGKAALQSAAFGMSRGRTVGADRQRARGAGAGGDRRGARRASSTPPTRAPSRRVTM
jgi:molybdate transport system substrate-binding protein